MRYQNPHASLSEGCTEPNLYFRMRGNHARAMPPNLRTWEVRLGITLLALSFAVYVVKYLLLGDP